MHFVHYFFCHTAIYPSLEQVMRGFRGEPLGEGVCESPDKILRLHYVPLRMTLWPGLEPGGAFPLSL